jgi:chemotaxis protein MotA
VDKASLIGVILGVAVCLTVGQMASHGEWLMFYSDKGVIMVFGGTISVIFMAMPMDRLKLVMAWLKRFMFNKTMSAVDVAKLMNRLSERARRDGILALENEVATLEDKFLASGLKMAVDGSSPDVIETTLRIEIMAMQERHKAGKKFFDIIKLYGPGYGLVATLIGQVGMFGHLGGSIEVMGKMLQIAVVATLYGTLLANAIAGPIGDKLALRSNEEILSREMVLQGILSIQAGDNPRITLDKMAAFVPQSARSRLQMAA